MGDFGGGRRYVAIGFDDFRITDFSELYLYSRNTVSRQLSTKSYGIVNQHGSRNFRLSGYYLADMK